jgi:hypothetical protein
MAERVGFEPTERFPAHSISSAANSTTLAPLPAEFRIADFGFTNGANPPRANLKVDGLSNPQSEIRNPKFHGGEGGIRTHGGR